MATTNPLTAAVEALWTLLEASPAFCAAVPVGSRIKRTGSIPNPILHPRPLDRDFPKVDILTYGHKTHQYSDSSGSEFWKIFSIEIKTRHTWIANDVDESDGLLDLEWIILRALTPWIATMEAITFGSQHPIADCRLLDATEQIDPSQAHKGWKVVWQGIIHFYFDTTSLTPA